MGTKDDYLAIKINKNKKKQEEGGGFLFVNLNFVAKKLPWLNGQIYPSCIQSFRAG